MVKLVPAASAGRCPGPRFLSSAHATLSIQQPPSASTLSPVTWGPGQLHPLHSEAGSGPQSRSIVAQVAAEGTETRALGFGLRRVYCCGYCPHWAGLPFPTAPAATHRASPLVQLRVLWPCLSLQLLGSLVGEFL